MSQHRTLNALNPLQDFHLRIQEDLHLARLHVKALELIDQDLSALTERLKAMCGGPEDPPCGLDCESSDDEPEVWAVLQEVDEDGNPVDDEGSPIEDEVRPAGEVIRGQEDGEGAILDDFEAGGHFGPLH